ncbi:MAG: hypothetical protein IPP99_16135 [Chitinophagaceae bacterium]|nr:hypothetical protein [Chitinophagaceae bacterium]
MNSLLSIPRVGSYDENRNYALNDIEIFIPYLVPSGQQERLSFIKPKNGYASISFYNGGFRAKRGDGNMSSVLDIQYRKPKKLNWFGAVPVSWNRIATGGADKKINSATCWRSGATEVTATC